MVGPRRRRNNSYNSPDAAQLYELTVTAVGRGLRLRMAATRRSLRAATKCVHSRRRWPMILPRRGDGRSVVVDTTGDAGATPDDDRDGAAEVTTPDFTATVFPVDAPRL